MKILLALTCLMLSAVTVAQVKPPHGFVSDSEPALKIGEAALMRVYGKKQIESERPFSAELKDGVWAVAGTLRCPDGKGGTTTRCVGGVAVVHIAQRDGRILKMWHTK